MLTKDQIKFLDEVCLGRWTEENAIINVDLRVDITFKGLAKIPVQFGRIYGYFTCRQNNLTTLEGSPSIIKKGYFNCDSNQLLTLEGGPKEVDLYYSCSHNNLTNLVGTPEICHTDFWCNDNQLTSLEGCPKIIKGNLHCHNNPNLECLWGLGRVEGDVYYDNKNEINKWIIECMRRDIIFPHFTLEENINWIKTEQKYSILLGAPEEIRKYFSPRILHLVDMGSYNESRILDYKTFKRIC